MIDYRALEENAANTANKARVHMLYVNGIFYSLQDSINAFCNEAVEKLAPCYGDKNNSKTAIKRKVIMLRQELLNLERMVEKC